jgi:hypothetical protein
MPSDNDDLSTKEKVDKSLERFSREDQTLLKQLSPDTLGKIGLLPSTSMETAEAAAFPTGPYTMPADTIKATPPNPINQVSPQTPPNSLGQNMASSQVQQGLGQINALAGTPNQQLYGNLQSQSSPLNNNQFTQNQIGSLNQQRGILTDEQRIAQNKADEEARINADAAKQQAQLLADQKTSMAKAMDDAQARDTKIRSMVQDQMSQNVDPDKFWNSKSTGQKATALVGIMLGGIGMGIAHRPGENPAMAQLNKMIDADIDSQKFNIDKNFKGIAQLHGLDESAFNRDMHSQLWKNNFRQAALEKVKIDLATTAAKSQSDMVKNNAARAQLDINNEQDKLRHQNYLLAQQQAAAGLAQQRKLQEQASKDIQELVKEKGVDPDEAAREVLRRPGNEPLLGGIMKQFNAQLDATVKQLAPAIASATGMKPEQAQEQAKTDAFNQVMAQNPQFNVLRQGTRAPGAPIVPDNTGAAEGAKKAEDEKKQRSELYNDLSDIHNFIDNYRKVNTDLIQGFPLTGDKREKERIQDEYRSRVLTSIAKMYKIDTSTNEPRNLELIHELSAPYLPASTTEPPEVTLRRMQSLHQKLYQTIAPSAGLTQPSMATTEPRATPSAAPTGRTAAEAEADKKPGKLTSFDY